MRRLLFLFGLSLAILSSALGQQKKTAQCTNLNAIISQMQEWRKSQTVIKFPLGNKRQKPLIGHPLLEAGGLRKGTGAFYASTARLTGEIASEFGIDDEGKCFYTAHMGPYAKEQIDKEGLRLKNLFLSCINQADWNVSDIPDVYLQISYNKVDVSVSVLKMPMKEADKYLLVISMFRFTPLK